MYLKHYIDTALGFTFSSDKIYRGLVADILLVVQHSFVQIFFFSFLDIPTQLNRSVDCPLSLSKNSVDASLNLNQKCPW